MDDSCVTPIDVGIVTPTDEVRQGLRSAIGGLGSCQVPALVGRASEATAIRGEVSCGSLGCVSKQSKIHEGCESVFYHDICRQTLKTG